MQCNMGVRTISAQKEKIGSNYRFRLGLQMYRMKTNETYSLLFERYNRDYKTWQRQQTFVNGTGIWVRTYNITTFQYHYGVNNTLYYTKTLIKFKKTSSSAPVFVYYTVHFDDNGEDLNTYPKDFINQIYLVAYGVEGLADNVDPEVYDAHQAFEIDKTKMKMLVPLNMNNQRIMNTNFDLKFKDLFKIFKCYTKYASQLNFRVLTKKSDNQVLSFTSPVVLHYISLHKTGLAYEKLKIRGNSGAEEIILNLSQNLRYTYMNNTHFSMLFILDSGISYIGLLDYKGSDFDVDIALSFN